MRHKGVMTFNAFCLVIALLVGIFMFYVFPEIFFFVFGFLLRARTRFSRLSLLLFSVTYVLILLEFVIFQSGSEVALVVVFVAACEVQCSAARFARDHSGCGPLQVYVELGFIRINFLTFFRSARC